MRSIQKIAYSVLAATVLLGAAGCENMSKRDKSMAIGAGAGAVGGALAGNQIQKNVTSDTYDISVRMDDGRTIVVNQRDLAGIRENTYVRVVNGRVILR